MAKTANKAELYLDGVSHGSRTLSSRFDFYHIGKAHPTARFQFNGWLDEVMLYDGAMDSNQVMEYYTRSSGGNAYCPGDQYNCEGCPAGMAGHWRLDETSGADVLDDAADNDGVNNGATINQAGQMGTAYSFDGSDDSISVVNSVNLNVGTGDFTLAAWVKTPADSNERTVLWKGYDYDSETGIALLISDDDASALSLIN